jgi:hypothetical protein
MARKPATRPEFALSMCFTKTVLSDRIAEFQVKSLVGLMGMLPRAPRSKNRIGLSLKGPANPPRPSRVSADPAENEPARNGTSLAEMLLSEENGHCVSSLILPC